MNSDNAKLTAELEDAVRELQEIAVSLSPYLVEYLQKNAGEHLTDMLLGPEQTLKYLTDCNPRIREAAFQLAYQHWEIKERLAHSYEQTAMSDPDIAVRETAVRALGTCYTRTKDARIGRLLAQIIRDDALNEGMRVTAFVALRRLHGNFDYTGPSPIVPISLQEIDWSLVEKYS